MTIVCDIDNVLNNLQEAVTNLFNERHGTNYTLEDFHDYNVENSLPLKEAMAMKDMYSESGIYDYVRPLPGSQDGLQKLIDAGHQVYLVTDTPPAIYHEKVKWVKHFFPFVDAAHIVAMKHKHLFKCDLMFEDNAHNLLAGVTYHRACMDYAWNRSVKDHVYDIHRCNDWKEFLNIVNKLKEEEWYV